ncbi:hypothetical protein Goshw_028392, partial [Gossypium schwendimanii]|nr:hypothetical protein [Gossypium schwendimanii]
MYSSISFSSALCQFHMEPQFHQSEWS